MTGSGLDSFPKFVNSKSRRAQTFITRIEKLIYKVRFDADCPAQKTRDELRKRRFFVIQAQDGPGRFGDRAHASHLRLLSQLIEGRAGLGQGPGAFVMMVLDGNTTKRQIRNVLRASKRNVREPMLSTLSGHSPLGCDELTHRARCTAFEKKEAA